VSHKTVHIFPTVSGILWIISWTLTCPGLHPPPPNLVAVSCDLASLFSQGGGGATLVSWRLPLCSSRFFPPLYQAHQGALHSSQ
jgi:hypothetical protein